MILVPTTDPRRLLDDIRSAVDAKRIRTWSYDADGDFTHTAEQWIREAWLRPSLLSDALKLSIIPPQDAHISSTIYAIYHGRFVETVLRHFDGSLSGQILVSIDPEQGDQVF